MYYVIYEHFWTINEFRVGIKSKYWAWCLVPHVRSPCCTLWVMKFSRDRNKCDKYFFSAKSYKWIKIAQLDFNHDITEWILIAATSSPVWFFFLLRANLRLEKLFNFNFRVISVGEVRKSRSERFSRFSKLF